MLKVFECSKVMNSFWLFEVVI